MYQYEPHNAGAVSVPRVYQHGPHSAGAVSVCVPVCVSMGPLMQAGVVVVPGTYGPHGAGVVSVPAMYGPHGAGVSVCWQQILLCKEDLMCNELVKHSALPRRTGEGRPSPGQSDRSSRAEC